MITLTKRSVTIFGFMAFFAYGSNSLAEVTTVIETEYSKLYSAVKLAENKIPDANEIRRKNEAFIKWGNYFSEYIESYFEGVKEIRMRVKEYKEAATGAHAENFLEIATALEKRAVHLQDRLDKDQRNLGALTQQYLKALNAEGGPRFEVNVIAEQINKIVVEGYGKELTTSYNMNTGDKDISTVLLRANESRTSLFGMGNYAAHSHINYLRAVSISKTKGLAHINFPVDDIDFIRWALGNKPGQEIKVEEMNIEDAVKNQSWLEWISDIGNSDYDCPKFDSKKSTLTFFRKSRQNGYTVKQACVNDSSLVWGLVNMDRSHTIDLLRAIYKKYPKVAEDGSRTP